MTYSTRPPVNPRFSSPPDELDGLLHRFYRAQLPDPWPAPPRVALENKTTPGPRRLAVGRFFRLPPRALVAAAVAFLVLGYLALQSWFPDPKPVKPAPLEPDLRIGKLLRPGHSIDRTSNGKPVSLDVHQSPSNSKSFIILVEPLPAKK